MEKLFKDLAEGTEFWWDGKCWKKIGYYRGESETTVRVFRPDDVVQVAA